MKKLIIYLIASLFFMGCGSLNLAQNTQKNRRNIASDNIFQGIFCPGPKAPDSIASRYGLSTEVGNLLDMSIILNKENCEEQLQLYNDAMADEDFHNKYRKIAMVHEASTTDYEGKSFKELVIILTPPEFQSISLYRVIIEECKKHGLL